jgi:hypothetical protein
VRNALVSASIQAWLPTLNSAASIASMPRGDSAAMSAAASGAAAGGSMPAKAHCSAAPTTVISTTSDSTPIVTRRSQRSSSPMHATASTPSRAYVVRMSPYQMKIPCTAPIASISPSRRSAFGQRDRPAAAARAACCASPKPKRSEKIEMNLKVASASTASCTAKSSVERTRPCGSGPSPSAHPIGRKKNRAFTRMMPRSAMPRAKSMPALRSSLGTGASVPSMAAA